MLKPNRLWENLNHCELQGMLKESFDSKILWNTQTLLSGSQAIMQTTSGYDCSKPNAKGESKLCQMLNWLTSEPWKKKQFKRENKTEMVCKRRMVTINQGIFRIGEMKRYWSRGNWQNREGEILHQYNPLFWPNWLHNVLF